MPRLVVLLRRVGDAADAVAAPLFLEVDYAFLPDTAPRYFRSHGRLYEYEERPIKQPQ
jgi:hypothetical protein